MPLTTYTYSMTNDFPGGKILPSNLVTEIAASSIVTALDHIDTNGDVVSIVFKGALSQADKTTLDGDTTAPAGGLIAAHNHTPPIPQLGIQFMDASGAIKPPMFDPSGRLFTTSMKPTTAKDNRISFNWCDKTTWYEKSVQSTNETLSDSGNGLTFHSAHTFWIDLYHGKVWQEDNLIAVNSKWTVTVKSNGTTLVQDSPGTHDGDYSVNFATGDVVFNSTQAGNTITATYWYAGLGVFTIKPQANSKMTFTRVEVQFAEDFDLQDTMVFTQYGYVQVFAPQYCPSPYPVNTVIPLGNLKYKSLADYYGESNGAYPVIQPLSNVNGNWRGMTKNLITLAWDYVSGTELQSSWGMSITLSLANNIPHNGSFVTATIYAMTEPEVA